MVSLDPSLFRFSDLPEDVGRIVFESLAEDHPHQTSLAVVSKKVQSWVEPVLYRHVVLHTQRKSGLFFRATQSNIKPKDFFALHVKSLLISFLSDPTQSSAILRVCTGVRSLACWVAQENSNDELKAIITSDLLHPIRLSIPGYVFPLGQSHFSHPIFHNISHLDVIWDHERRWDWDALRELHHLTHISIDVQFECEHPAQLTKRILALCPPTLRVFVIFVARDYYFYVDDYHLPEIRDIYEGLVDPRAVIAYMGTLSGEGVVARYAITRPYTDILYDWGRLLDGDKDTWSRAEEMIKERNYRKSLASQINRAFCEPW